MGSILDKNSWILYLGLYIIVKASVWMGEEVDMFYATQGDYVWLPLLACAILYMSRSDSELTYTKNKLTDAKYELHKLKAYPSAAQKEVDRLKSVLREIEEDEGLDIEFIYDIKIHEDE